MIKRTILADKTLTKKERNAYINDIVLYPHYGKMFMTCIDFENHANQDIDPLEIHADVLKWSLRPYGAEII